ncbi:MAG: hydrogenase formation protein HypD [Burkholderiales bacterium]|nr:hydrogenase formation protein HypD [Burkholderiales bacterium]
MKHLDEYRDPGLARACARRIARIATRPWAIMEICGGQTHAIMRFGIDALLPAGIELLHGPGCPVCVTPVEMIDSAIAIAFQPDVILASFGDMLRVPGSGEDLLSARARGAQVRVVLSPLDALPLARANPERQVVFFAVGFETTAPATALAVAQAAREGLANFSMLCAHVRVPPAIEAILEAPGNRVQGFLAAGHVCTVMGYTEYEPLAARHRVPIVVTGFEPLDILHGTLACVEQLEAGRAQVENCYARAVRREGNPAARELIGEVFDIVPRRWRGMGEIAASGFALRDRYARFDARRRFTAAAPVPAQPSECLSGLVLRGAKKPHECPAFGTRCTPERPLGATMVSSEGACAAYYRYRRPVAIAP